jgi:hypothetical protein
MGNKLSIESLTDLWDTTPSQPGWNNCLKCSLVYYGDNIPCAHSGIHIKDGYTYNIYTELPSSGLATAGTYVNALWCKDCGVAYGNSPSIRSYCTKTFAPHSKAGSGNYAIRVDETGKGPYSICILCSNIYNTERFSICPIVFGQPHSSNGQMLKIKSSEDSTQNLISVINAYESLHKLNDTRIYQVPNNLVRQQWKGPKYHNWTRIGNTIGENESQWITIDSVQQTNTIRYDLIVGFKVSISSSDFTISGVRPSFVVGIDGVFYRNSKYLGDESKTYYKQLNIGQQTSAKLDSIIPPAYILVGLSGSSSEDAPNIINFGMIIKNIINNEIAFKPILSNSVSLSDSIFLFDEPTPNTPIQNIMCRVSDGTLRAITTAQYNPDTNNLLSYCLQFINSSQTENSVKLPQTFKTYHSFQSGLKTSEMILRNQFDDISRAGGIPTPTMNINTEIDTKCIVGFNIAYASNGIHVGGFKYNKYTNLDNPNLFEDKQVGQTPASYPPNSRLNDSQILLPKNSYVCGFAAASSDPFNPSLQTFLPIIKMLDDPFTPIIMGDGIANLSNYPDFSYYYMDLPDYYCSPEQISYIEKNNINDIFQVRFKNISQKTWSMLDPGFAGQNALVQYNYLDKNLNGITYTPRERQSVANNYCGTKIFELKDDPETKACKTFITKISSIQMDDAINKFCTIHPTNDLCSCSDSYRNSDINSLNTTMRTLITNNKTCFYPRCKTSGYMYTNQLDSSFSRPPKCDQNLSICEQNIGNINVTDNAILNDFKLTCNQSGYKEKENTPVVNNKPSTPTQTPQTSSSIPSIPTPSAPNPTTTTINYPTQTPTTTTSTTINYPKPIPTPSPTNIQNATTVAESRDFSNIKKVGIIVIFVIIVGIMYYYVSSTSSQINTNDVANNIAGGYENIDINSPDFVVV